MYSVSDAEKTHLNLGDLLASLFSTTDIAADRTQISPVIFQKAFSINFITFIWPEAKVISIFPSIQNSVRPK